MHRLFQQINRCPTEGWFGQPLVYKSGNSGIQRQVAWGGFFKQVVCATEFPTVFPVMTLKLSKK